MSVPYIFSNVPGGSSIPLAQLDANFAYLATSPTLEGLTVTGTSTFNGPMVINGSITIGSNTVTPTGITGTGDLVFNNGPTFVSPDLGTPIAGNLAFCTGYPIAAITGLASGIIPFLQDPTSANLRAAVVDETGTGSLVFNNGPSLLSPNLTNAILNTPASGDLVNCTGYLAANLNGVLSIAKGGTGLSSVGTVGQVLTVVGGGLLGYQTLPPASSLAGGLPSQIPYQSAPDTTAFVPNGTAGQVLTSNGTAAPSWNDLNAATQITGVLPELHGGTGLSNLGLGVQSALSNDVNTTGGFVTYPGNFVPTGAVMYFAQTTAPAGWLFCGGAAVSRTTYANLFAAIGTTYGPGDGSTTFNVPDLNGVFIRSWDSTGLIDPGRGIGTGQSDSLGSHTHTANVTDPGHQHQMANLNGGVTNGTDFTTISIAGSGIPGTPTTIGATTGVTVSNDPTGGTETRPINVALPAYIKY